MSYGTNGYPPRRPPIKRAAQPAKPTQSSTGLPLAECEFCHEPIVWAETFPNRAARTAEGREPKLVPIDPEPTTDQRANLAVTQRPQGRPQVGEMRHGQAAGYREAGGKVYIRHVKTCTKAAEMLRGIVRNKARRR